MRKTLSALILGVTVGVSGVSAMDLDNNTGASRDDQVLQILSEGVQLYYTGRYDEAAAALRTGLKLYPDDQNKLIYDFFLAIGYEKLLAMQERAELAPVMKDILRRYRIYQSDLRRSPGFIKLLIEKLDKGTEEQRLVATKELVAIGPIAVPYLVERLTSNREDDMRVYARVVLTDMGYRAVVPLCEVLKSNEKQMVQAAITSLTDIRDPRALPHIQRIVDTHDDEEVKRVARNAIAALASVAGFGAIPEGPILYFQEAMRYFRDGDFVTDEMRANEHLMWRWSDEPVVAADAGEEATPMRLVYEVVPQYAWNELMAEQLLFDGASAYTEFTAFFPLMAANMAAQNAEVDLRLRIAVDRVTPPSTPEETIAALELRQEALGEQPFRVAAFGPKHLYRAIEQAIVNERYDVAVSLMRTLQDEWTAQADALLPSREDGLMGEKAGSVLVAALDYPEKRIRYQAAITLAHLDPSLDFLGVEKVIPILAEAVGEWGMKVVLVVEPDYRERNAARKALMSRGFLVFTANDGFEARTLLAKTPVKDAIIVAADLDSALRDENGQVIDVPEQNAAGLIAALKEDPATASTPILTSLPENQELAVKLENALAGIADGAVNKPYSDVELSGVIDSKLGDDALPDVNRQEREDISLRAAIALGTVDPVRSHMELAGAVDALVGTLANRSDPIRNAALTALGHSGASAVIDNVTDVYQAQDPELTPETRAAFVRCIGLLNPNTPAAVDILKKAVMYDTGSEDPDVQALERAVREAAHAAIGHAADITNQLLLEYQIQQRLDVRAPGAGTAE